MLAYQLCFRIVLIIVCLFSYKAIVDRMFLSNANKHIFSVLTILGVVPFIGCAALLLCNIYALPVIGNVAATINVYGLLIASFIAGSHWGKALVEDTVQPGVAASHEPSS